jgi:hypothetical protein
MGLRLPRFRLIATSLVLVVLASCGGGGGGGGGSSAPLGPRAVTLAWAPNHENGVNSAGGGYQVSISGQPTINVPYVSGPTAPTSTVIPLPTGTYTVTVSAFAALDTQGGSTGSTSAPSQSIVVNVP